MKTESEITEKIKNIHTDIGSGLTNVICMNTSDMHHLIVELCRNTNVLTTIRCGERIQEFDSFIVVEVEDYEVGKAKRIFL